MPDDETRVLFAAGEEIEIGGYHAEVGWVTDAETVFGDDDVYAWAHLPPMPELVGAKGGAS
jgi:hypothetical protein